MDVAGRGANLGVGIRRQILAQEVDEPGVTLQQCEQLHRAIAGIVAGRWRSGYGRGRRCGPGCVRLLQKQRGEHIAG